MSTGGSTAPFPTGWIDDQDQVNAALATMIVPLFAIGAPHLAGDGRGKTTLLYKAWKDVNKGQYIDYPAQTIGDCFASGTMVLGETTKPIEEVEVGDGVWTAEGRMARVISTRMLVPSSPLVEIAPFGGLPMTCTSDHRFLVYRLRRFGRKRLTPNMAKRHPACAACFDGRVPMWVSASDLRDTDYLLTPISKESMPIPDSPEGIFDWEDGRFLAGYFLGNGHASHSTVEFTFPRSSGWIGQIHDAAERLGWRPKYDEHKVRRSARLRVNSVELAAWFRGSFYRRDTKSFPGCMSGDSSFMDGLRQSDGHGDSRVNRLDSTSKSIIYAAYSSLVALGYEPTIAPVYRSAGTYDNAKPLYRLTWMAGKQKQYTWRDEKFVCHPVESIRRLDGRTVVYDIGVEDSHHSFLANGFGAHNCVSQGFGHGVDLLSAVEIAIAHELEEFKQTATEAIYGMARVDVGGQRGSYSDGAVGAWAAKAVSTLGTVSRELVGEYDGQRAKTWGARGVPDDIKSKAIEHPVKTASLIATYEELEDALANGYPVTVCSNQGFTLQRDKDGFCRPQGHWAHCMLIVGTRTDLANRPGACIFQSWGSTVPSGPLALDQPPNSFWAERSVIERMLGARDSWSLSQFTGYRRQVLPDQWSWGGFA